MKKRSILIVEDDGIIAIDLKETLERLGYGVLAPVATGRRAMTAAKKHKPDLVLMDIDLPGAMNGIEAAGKIREGMGIPVIYLTGYSQDTLIQQAKQTEPYGYLVKPVSERELAAAVEIALYKNDMDRKLKESEEHYHNLLEQAGDGIFVVGRDHRFIMVNPKICEMLGYTEAELLSLSVFDTYPENLLDEAKECLKQVSSEGRFSFVRPVKRKDGTIITMEINTTVMEDGTVQGIGRDITTRKLAEDALRESEAMLSRSQQIAHVGSWKLDLTTNHLTWSDEVYRIFGIKPQEFTATYKAFLGTVHPDDRPMVDNVYRESVRSGRDSYEVEHRIVRRNSGEVRYVHERCVHERDASGTILRSVGMVQDITERISAEKAIHESEERYRRITDAVTDYIFTVTVKNRKAVHTVHSHACVGVTGYTSEEFATDPDLWISMVHEDDRDLVRRQAEGILKGTSFNSVEHRIIRKDGSIRWVKNTPVPQHDRQGRLVSYDGIISDITERKRAEAELQESEWLYRTLFEIPQDGMALAEAETGILVRCNKALCRMVEREEAELIGQSQAVLHPPHELTKGHSPSYIMHREGGPELPQEDTLLSKSGKQIPVEIVAANVRIDERDCLLGVFRDITERKRAEEELARSEGRIRRRLESLLAPEGDIGTLELGDLLDISALQALMDDFTRASGTATAILDTKGTVLVATGWQDICTRFHRVHQVTAAFCTESDLALAKGLKEGEYTAYKCRNNLWDVVTPLYIGGRHMGNIFTGQFFYDDDIVDESVFVAQAKACGFDRDAYLDALHRVPRLSRDRVRAQMEYLVRMTGFISKLSHSNLSLARTVHQRDELVRSLQESEDALREEKALLSKSQAIAHVGSWKLDLSTNHLTWSDEVYRIYGYRPQEFAVTYEAFIDYVHPDDRTEVNEAYSGSLREGVDSYEMEHRIVQSGTGDIRWVHERCVHERDDAGKIIRSVGMVHDITERKRAEEVLQVERDLMQSVINGARNSHLVYLDRDFNFVLVNETYAASCGYRPEEMIGKNHFDLYPHEENESIFRHVRDTGEPFSIRDKPFEYPDQPGRGTTYWDWTLTPVKDREGWVSGLIFSLFETTERKRAEKELLESEERFRILSEAAFEAIAIHEEGVLIHANDQYFRMFGYEPGEALGKQMLSRTIAPEAMEITKKQIATGGVGPYESTGVRKDGTIFPIEIRAQIMVYKGRHVRFAAIVDITERKRAEEALIKSEEKFRKAFYTGSDSVNINRLEDGVYISINPGFTRITGYTEEEIIGKSSIEYNIWNNIEDRQRLVAGLRKDGEVINLDAAFRMKGGDIRYGLMSASVIDLNGVPHILSITRDITERKLNEEVLRQERERLAGILRGTNAGTWEWNVQTGETIFNQRWAEIIGYSLDELSPVSIETWIKFTHPDDLKTSDELLQKHFSGELDYYECEARMRHKSGAWVWVLDRGRVTAWTDDGKPIMMMGTHQDITERKIAEEALHKSEERFSSIYKLSPEIITISRMDDGTLLDVNEAFERQLGFSRDESIGHTSVELGLWAESEHLARMMHAFRNQNERLHNFETYLRGRDGRTFSVLISAAPIEIRDERLLLLIATDITEMKLAEESLLQSERRLNDIIDFLPDATLAIDSEKKVIVWNRAIERMTGIKAADMLGKGDYEYTLPFYGERRPQLMDLVWEENRSIEEKYPYVNREGESLMAEAFCNALYNGRGAHVFAKVSPLHDQKGNIVGAIESIRDISERKRSEEVIRASEEKFSKAFHSAPMLMTISAVEDGRLIDVNEMFTSVSGFSREECIGRTPIELGWISPELRERVMENLRKDGRVKGMELLLHAKDGHEVYCLFSGEVINIGGVPRFLIIAEDITQRKRAEEDLEVSLTKYRVLFDSFPHGIAIADKDGHVMESNKKAEELTGISTDEHLKRTIDGKEWHIIRTDGTPMPADEFASTIALKENRLVQNVEMGIVKGKYDVTWLNVTAAPIPLEDLCVAITYSDITERTKADEEIRRLASAVEQSAECVVITDLSGTIQYVNPVFEGITGYTREEAIGNNSRILKSGVQDEAFYQNLWETINRGETWSGRFVNKRKNGTLYHEDASISPIRDKSGAIVNFVAVKKDITKEVELEEQLMRSQKLEAIGTLAGGIAHDFNNILSAIIGFSEIAIEMVPARSETHNHVAEILKAGERAKDLVKQILTFSRQVESKREPVRVHLIAKETIKLLHSSIPKNISIVDRINPKTVPVEGDPTKIHQVIMNLCTNAYHAMVPDGGNLTVSLATVELNEEASRRMRPLKPGPHMCLKVSDTGIGMDEATMKRIFDPFFTTKEKGKGTGLGLATVYGIVTELGGAIDIDSAPGKGSTFTVYFPATERKAGEKEEMEPEPLMATMKGHIMVVDDEESIIQFTRIMLEQLGYTISGMTSSLEALMLFRSAPERFDLVMTDHVMPEMTGMQLSVEMLKIRPDLPIIIMTGYSETVDEEKARAAGIKEYVEKPFTRRLMSQLIKKYIEEKDKGKE